MLNQYTDGEIARIFTLSAEIAAVRASMPAAPSGFDVSLEAARGLRASLAEHQSALTELGRLLSAQLSD